jgi:hypothetical protein
MTYPSVDRLQKVLAESVFHYAKDAKKAAGRALGTLVEIITFYALKSWGLERHVAIERPLPEFANAGITHNVEYTIHPSKTLKTLEYRQTDLPITAKKIVRDGGLGLLDLPVGCSKCTVLLTKGLILRNSCTIADTGSLFYNAYLDAPNENKVKCTIAALHSKPFAMFECKRVGIEEGMLKGPQTIEKAKQGAYVARTVSSLQKIRFIDGTLGGLIQRDDGTLCCKDFYTLMAEIIAGNDREMLANFILTVGVVSNHGNWFTSTNHNKELKVLAQSYDWLLFLSDNGIAQFIDELLLHPKKKLCAARSAFLASYTGQKGVNQFTKVQIALAADAALQWYFASQSKVIVSWFNIITPVKKPLAVLRDELDTLKNKNWQEIHQ